jgi:hypothetical protein
VERRPEHEHRQPDEREHDHPPPASVEEVIRREQQEEQRRAGREDRDHEELEMTSASKAYG